MPSKIKIKDYEHFKKLVQNKEIKKKWSAAKICSKFDVGLLQILAWMSRYSTEKELTK
jgi:hypothetical protein